MHQTYLARLDRGERARQGALADGRGPPAVARRSAAERRHQLLGKLAAAEQQDSFTKWRQHRRPQTMRDAFSRSTHAEALLSCLPTMSDLLQQIRLAFWWNVPYRVVDVFPKARPRHLEHTVLTMVPNLKLPSGRVTRRAESARTDAARLRFVVCLRPTCRVSPTSTVARVAGVVRGRS